MQDFHPQDTVGNDAVGTHGHTPFDVMLRALIAPADQNDGAGEHILRILAALRDAGFEVVNLPLLSAALDEIYRLRRALAYEARVVEAHTLDLKSLSKSRSMILAAAVQRMRGGVTSSAKAYSGISYKALDSEAREYGCEYLTRQSWADEVAAKASS